MLSEIPVLLEENFPRSRDFPWRVKWMNQASPKRQSYCCYSVAQSCLTFGDPMDHSPSGASVLGIFQARILGWVAISFSRHLLNPGIKLTSPAWQDYSLAVSHLGSPKDRTCFLKSQLFKPSATLSYKPPEVLKCSVHLYLYLKEKKKALLLSKFLFNHKGEYIPIKHYCHYNQAHSS